MYHHQKELQADLYSTHILDQLLDSHKDWDQVQQIVPLTFKAVTDMLATHSQALKDIKAVLTTRASKTELTTGLALKTNISDISKTVQQLSLALDERPSFTELNTSLRQYATKNDLNDVMAMAQTGRQVAVSAQERQNVELSILKTRMDEFQREITKKVGMCATLEQFNEITNILESKVPYHVTKANTAEINEVLQQKVTKQYVSTALQKKANKSDIEAMLIKKADSSDFQYMVNSLESKVSVSTLDKLTQVLDNKVDRSQLAMFNNERSMHNRSQLRLQEEEWGDKLEHVRNAFALEMKEIKKHFQLEVKETQGVLQLFKKEIQIQMRKFMSQSENDMNKRQSKLKLQVGEDIESVKQVMRALQDDATGQNKSLAVLAGEISQRKRGQENIYHQIDEVKRKLEQTLCKMVNQVGFIDFKSEVMGIIQGKADLDQVQRALDNFQSAINIKIVGDKTQNMQMMRQVKQMISQSAEKSMIEVQELRKEMLRKQERGQSNVNEESFRKVRKQIGQCRKTVDNIYDQVKNRLSLQQYETDLAQIRKRFDFLHKQLSIKANIKDVCVLADSKPNIDEVNNALRQINEALSTKVSDGDLESVLKDLATVNETLCTENIVGRWMWHSGETKPGSIIPWESQSTNTVPDYFFWEKDKTSILIISAGVYEITACVFSKNANVCIEANGDVINMSRGEEKENMGNAKGKKRKDKGLGSTSVSEYLLLPARSRVSVKNYGQGFQGFLNIRRF